MLHRASFRFAARNARVVPAIPKGTESASFPSIGGSIAMGKSLSNPEQIRPRADKFPLLNEAVEAWNVEEDDSGTDTPNSRLAAGSVVHELTQRISALEPAVRFRFVAQGSPVKCLYQIHRESDEGCNDEWIPLCWKIRKHRTKAPVGYHFSFTAPAVKDMGMVLLGRCPNVVFMFPSDVVAGQTFANASANGNLSEYQVETEPDQIASVLMHWWDDKLIPRVTSNLWVKQLLGDETGGLSHGKSLLLHTVAQVEKMLKKSFGWDIDYSEVTRTGMRFRGNLNGKDIIWRLGSPTRVNTYGSPIYKMTFWKGGQSIGDFVLGVPHVAGQFDRFFLLPRDFIYATVARRGCHLKTYYMYPSDRHCVHPSSKKLQSMQEKFEIKCDQHALQILPGYEEKFRKILDGDIT